MSRAHTLFRLQQNDSQADRVRARLGVIEKSLEDDASIKQAVRLAESAASELAVAEQHQNELDEEIKSLRIKIEQTESSLYGGVVRNPKELQDLQNESAALKRHLLFLEDRLLEAMLTVEETLGRNKEAQASRVVAQSMWIEQNQNLSQEQASLIKDIQKLNIERIAITKSLAAEQIELYEKLREQRQGLAVSGIQENACNACGTTLTLALVQASRSSEQISRCPSCGRILYGI